MKRLTEFATIILLLAAAGCNHNSYAGNSNIIIDTKGVDMQVYQTDLYQCQQYAAQVAVAERSAKTAGAGAVIGGVLGAVVGDSSTAKRGAGVGAVSGGLRGAGSAIHEKRRVVKNCLQGRGYQVINYPAAS